ncbi:MAG: hypothetical protein ABEJ60_03925 [Halodesulfurarchaeum sp.]
MVEFEPIGTVHSPIGERTAAPSHGVNGDDSGRIEVDPDYATGLQGLDRPPDRRRLARRRR